MAEVREIVILKVVCIVEATGLASLVKYNKALNYCTISSIVIIKFCIEKHILLMISEIGYTLL